jgi:ABC-type antimicrobial peptide transport system permease subunit
MIMAWRQSVELTAGLKIYSVGLFFLPSLLFPLYIFSPAALGENKVRRKCRIACLLAFPLLWWMMYNWLQRYEYRIAISWWVFLAAGGMAVLIALLTISFQTIKAAIANPVKSLRNE